MPSKYKVSTGDKRLTHPYMQSDILVSWQKAKIIREGPLADGVFQKVSIERDGVITYTKTL